MFNLEKYLTINKSIGVLKKINNINITRSFEVPLLFFRVFINLEKNIFTKLIQNYLSTFLIIISGLPLKVK